MGLLKLIWKVLKGIMDHQLNAIKLHDCLHGCQADRRTDTMVIEAKMAQQLLYLKLKPFYGVFLYLRKAFDLMDQDCYIMILEGQAKRGFARSMMVCTNFYWYITICEGD